MKNVFSTLLTEDAANAASTATTVPKAKDFMQKADAQMKKIQEDKDTPPNWQELLRDKVLRQEVEELLKSPAVERAEGAP